MKLNFSENPKNCRISTYLTADEALELQKLIGEKSVASWLRDMVLTAIIDQRAFNELKAEIERLKAELSESRSVINTAHYEYHNYKDYQSCRIEELEKQVDELTEERDKAKRDNTSLIYNISRVEKENDELRKQVEELKIYLASEKVCSKQAVKDTAKEVYTQVLEWLPICGDYTDYTTFVNNIETWLKDRYGVEVE